MRIHRRIRILRPTWKSPEIDALLTSITGKDRIDTIRGRRCTICSAEGLISRSFRDTLSLGSSTLSLGCTRNAKIRSRMEGHVYIPSDRLGWWGGLDTRPRCSTDNKVVFPDQLTAEAAADRIRNTTLKPYQIVLNESMSAYQGKCGFWHVGHSRRKAG